VFVLLTVLALGATLAQGAPPATGDWVVTGDETYTGQTITLEGNLTVAPGGNLTLLDVVLEINSTPAARRGVTVQGTGKLTTGDLDGSAATPLDRTFVRPLGAGEAIFFVAEAGSTLNLSQTAVRGVGYTQSPLNASGIYLDHAFVTLSNLTVSNSFFGLVLLGDFGNVTLSDITVHNSTYDGVLLRGATNVYFRGLISADNGGAGLQAANGTSTLRSVSFLRNGDGLAVKFGATSNVQAFDASGNQNGVVALTDASIVMSLGRVTNNTNNGVDARISSVVSLTSVTLSDNPTHVYVTGGSTYNQAGGSLSRGIIGFHARTGSNVSVLDATVQGMSGSAFEIDSSYAEFMRVSFAGIAVGGSVNGGTGFVFIDSSLTGSTVGGFLFFDTAGVILHNPTFRDNRGSSVVMTGSSTGRVSASLAATFVNTTAVLDNLNVTGTLWVENSTLHVMRARAWVVTGSFHGERGGIIGDVAGASLTVRQAASLDLSQFGVGDFALHIDGDPSTASVQGFSVIGSGALEASNGTLFSWRNVTAVTGGTVRVSSGTLELVGGSATDIAIGDGSTLWLRDYLADVPGATYGAGASLYETWSVTVQLEWAPGVRAPGQAAQLQNVTGQVAAAGTTGSTGQWDAGYVRARTGTASGVVSDNPYSIVGGSGSWVMTATASISAPTLAIVQLNDLTAPSVVITSPAQGAGTRADPVVVVGMAADGESGLGELAWSYDNASFNVVAVTGFFSIPVAALVNTSYTVTVRATDLAGNRGWAEVTFLVDRIDPTITLSAPVNGSRLKGPDLTVSGRTEVGANLTVSGQGAAVDALGDFTHVLTLVDGVHTIVLVAVDAAGNSATLAVVVTLDSTPPAIVVESPLNNTVLASDKATLTGRVEPGASLSVDGLAYAVLSNGSFSADAFLDLEGLNSFVLRSVDAAGNENEVVWVLVRDTQAPTVSVAGLEGAGPWVINTTSPAFQITVDEDAVIEASTGSGSNLATFTGASALYRPVLLDGNTTLNITATDAGGNRNTVVFALRVDVVPPDYTLDPATAGGLVRQNPWALTITTEPGAQVTVGGAPAQPTTPGGTTFQATVDLEEGVNQVAVSVTDAAGNRLDFSVTITLDSQPPSLRIESPEDGARVSEGSVLVVGTAETGATVTVGGSPATVDAAGRFEVDYPLLRGPNTIVVEATDPAGNTAHLSLVVTRAGGVSGELTGIDFIDDNLYFLLLLVAVAVAGAAVATRGRRRRRQLARRSAALGDELESAVNLRGDLGAADNFSPRQVQDSDFQSFEDFQRKQGGGPPGGGPRLP
jgi:hypothetical protein